MQIPRGRISWIERFEPPDRAFEVVLYLGCNVLRTPDIDPDAPGSSSASAFDFVATAGVLFCCGITWHRANDDELGRGVSERSVERLSAYKPQIVVFWCPSCNVHFDDILMGRDGREAPFAITHCSTFLAERAQRWRDPLGSRWSRAGWLCIPTWDMTAMRPGGGAPTRTGRHPPASWSTSPGWRCSAGLTHLRSSTTTAAPVRPTSSAGAGSTSGSRAGPRSSRDGSPAPWSPSPMPSRESGATSAANGWRCATTSRSSPTRSGIERDYEVDLLGTYQRQADPRQIMERGRTAWSSHGISEQQALETASK